MYISQLVEELEKKKYNDIISMTCFLWLYQNIVEILLAHISEIFALVSTDRSDKIAKRFLEEYKRAVEKEEHLTSSIQDCVFISNSFLTQIYIYQRMEHLILWGYLQ